MKNLIACVLSFSFFVSTPTPVQPQQRITSLYTDLTPAKCKTIEEDEETGSAVQSCPGVAGYTLLIDGDDNRMSITVVDPKGKKHPLNYWEVITYAFSYLGNKAEWRVVKKPGQTVPLALIVRVNASENPNEPNRVTSYYYCVTNKFINSAGRGSGREAGPVAAGTAG